MFDLRQFQSDDSDRIKAAFAAGHKRVLYVLPTGGGKTVTSSHFMAGAKEKGNESMFLAHRREIIFQTGEKLEDAGIEYGTIMAGHRKSIMHDVWLASIQTLVRRDFPNVKFLIIDEAHHSVATSYKKVIDQYPDAWILGLTATPCRGDGRGLGSIFQHMVVGPSVSELIDWGYLVPARIFNAKIPSMDDLKIKMGDYSIPDASARLNRPKLVGDIVEQWLKHAKGLRTIIFATDIAHSLHIERCFNEAGIKAEHIDGDTPKEARKAIFARHRSGETTVLCNVGVATEGYDDPGIRAVVLARPTKSFGLYLQMAGRGLRPAPGKEHLLLLDHADTWSEHGGPDEPVAWSLDPDTLAFSKNPKKTKGESKLPGQWRCEHCGYVNTNSVYCDSCGLRRTTTAKTPEVALGQLVEVTQGERKKWGRAEKERVWTECMWKAIQIDRRSKKGMKAGAAFHMYVKETGQNPHHTYPMMPKAGQWQMRASKFYDTWKANQARG